MNIPELKRMSISERLQAMEAIWDSFLYENEEIEPPSWHEEILNGRKNVILNGNAKFISISELKKAGS